MLSENRRAQGECPDASHFTHDQYCAELRDEKGDAHCRCRDCPECGRSTFDPLDDDEIEDDPTPEAR